MSRCSTASGIGPGSSEAATDRVSFFLIEDPQKHSGDCARWWTGERLQFLPDANAAARFTSRRRAESAMQRLGLSHLIVTEHTWPDEPTAALGESPAPPTSEREAAWVEALEYGNKMAIQSGGKPCHIPIALEHLHEAAGHPGPEVNTVRAAFYRPLGAGGPPPEDGPPLIAQLEERIQRSAHYGEDENMASWDHEEGVLLSRAEAQIALAALRRVPPGREPQ
jgi:hypothetical protein